MGGTRSAAAHRPEPSPWQGNALADLIGGLLKLLGNVNIFDKNGGVKSVIGNWGELGSAERTTYNAPFGLTREVQARIL